jgi:hypothetical protein
LKAIEINADIVVGVFNVGYDPHDQFRIVPLVAGKVCQIFNVYASTYGTYRSM